MTRILFAILFLSISSSTFSQKNERASMLWEITGNNQQQPSYIFGSVHINDPKVFELDDSLLYAIKSCPQFAAEVDISKINAIFIEKLLGEVMTSEKSEKDEKNEKKELIDFDLKGMPTFLDAYLYRIALNLGAKSFGLEQLGDQLDDLLSQPELVEDYDPQSEKFKQLVENYNKGFIKLEPSKEELQKYRMAERNEIQANSLIDLMKTSPTFAVVGAGHLFWEKNVLELLRQKGFKTKRVGFGKVSKELKAIYNQSDNKEWSVIQNSQIGVSVKSNAHNELKTTNSMSMHSSMELDRGLMYITMFMPVTSDQAKDVFENKVSEMDFLPPASNIKIDINTDTLRVISFDNNTKAGPQKGRMTFKNGLLAMQMVHGLSNSAIKHPNVDRYLNGLEFIPKAITTWQNETLPEYDISLFFPKDIAFSDQDRGYEELGRGSGKLRMKTFEDTTGTYLFLIQETPPGVIFPPYQSALESVSNLTKAYKAELIEVTNSMKQDHLFTQAKLKNDDGSMYFVQIVFHGNLNIINIQKSKERNNAFFEMLKFNSPTSLEKNSTTHKFEQAKISLKLPKNRFTTYQNEFGEDHTAYNFYGLGTTLDIHLEKGDQYTEYLLSDSMFVQDNLFDNTVVDSLYSFRTFKYDNICPAFVAEYATDSSMLITTEMHIYCNDHIFQVTIQTPLFSWNHNVSNNLIKGIKVEVSPTSLEYLTKRKADFLLNDLFSTDSTIFNTASNSLYYYEFLPSDSISKIIRLINKPLMDDESEYSTKEQLIQVLASIDFESCVNELVKIYRSTDSINIKQAVITALSYKKHYPSLDTLFDLLDEPIDDKHLPKYGLYSQLRDSSEIFLKYKNRVLDLIKKQVTINDGLYLFNGFLEKDSLDLITDDEKQALTVIVNEEISKYLSAAKSNPEQTVSTAIIEYCKFKTFPWIEESFYNTIEKGIDNDSKFIVCSNLISEEKTPSKALLKSVLGDEHHSYYLISKFFEKKVDIPYKLLLNEKVVSKFIESYLMDELYYDSLAVINRKIGKNKEVYFEAALKAYDQEGYYFVQLGPIDKKGQVTDFYSLLYTDYETYPLDQMPEIIKKYGEK